MSAVAAAIGVAGIGGALIAGSASQNAANTQSQAADRSNQLQQTEYNQQMANAAPWLTAGKDALGQLQTQMPDLTRKFTMDDFHQDPGYQFQLNQGLTAMQRSAAAKGMLSSTGTQQNLNNYAQGMANTDYQQALSNFTNNQQQRYNMLAGISGQGLTATGLSNATSMNYANNVGQNNMGAANASAAGQIGMANAVTGGMGNLANNYMGYSMMNNLVNRPGGGMPTPMYGAGAGMVGGNMAMPYAGADTGTSFSSLLS